MVKAHFCIWNLHNCSATEQIGQAGCVLRRPQHLWVFQMASAMMLSNLGRHDLIILPFFFPSKGEADEGDQTLPLPRLAGGGNSRWGEGYDRHHRLGSAPAAAVWGSPHRRTLQVTGQMFRLRRSDRSGFWNLSLLLRCSAGAGRTGTFIALSNILERVKAEGLLDVFQTVKSLRMQRPHMVQTVVSISRSTTSIRHIQLAAIVIHADLECLSQGFWCWWWAVPGVGLEVKSQSGHNKHCRLELKVYPQMRASPWRQTVVTTQQDGGSSPVALWMTHVSALAHPVVSWFLLPTRLNGGHVNRI